LTASLEMPEAAMECMVYRNTQTNSVANTDWQDFDGLADVPT